MDTRTLVTCEHGGHEVPVRLQTRFEGAEAVLRSHRGWDPGALPLAERLAVLAATPLRFATVTRLVVDLNRSPGHPRLFSEFTRFLDADERERLLARYHRPYRDEVDRLVAGWLDEGCRVVHLGVHTFTPILDGVVRDADVGLLYDPVRPRERALADAWVRGLRSRLPDLAIRRNQPYRGRSDGLTTWLRRRGAGYLGIEIEINQRLLDGAGRFPDRVVDALLHTYPAAALPV